MSSATAGCVWLTGHGQPLRYPTWRSRFTSLPAAARELPVGLRTHGRRDVLGRFPPHERTVTRSGKGAHLLSHRWPGRPGRGARPGWGRSRRDELGHEDGEEIFDGSIQKACWRRRPSRIPGRPCIRWQPGPGRRRSPDRSRRRRTRPRRTTDGHVRQGRATWERVGGHELECLRPSNPPSPSCPPLSNIWQKAT